MLLWINLKLNDNASYDTEDDMIFSDLHTGAKRQRRQGIAQIILWNKLFMKLFYFIYGMSDPN